MNEKRPEPITAPGVFIFCVAPLDEIEEFGGGKAALPQ